MAQSVAWQATQLSRAIRFTHLFVTGRRYFHPRRLAGYAAVFPAHGLVLRRLRAYRVAAVGPRRTRVGERRLHSRLSHPSLVRAGTCLAWPSGHRTASCRRRHARSRRPRAPHTRHGAILVDSGIFWRPQHGESCWSALRRLSPACPGGRCSHLGRHGGVSEFSLGMGYSKFCFGVLSVLALPLGRVPSLLLLGLFAAHALASTRGTHRGARGYSQE